MSKWFLVSEEELERLRSKHKKASHTWDSGTQEDWLEAVEQEQQAEAACRAREVPEWAAGFCSEPIETSSDYPIIEQFEGIKR